MVQSFNDNLINCYAITGEINARKLDNETITQDMLNSITVQVSFTLVTA